MTLIQKSPCHEDVLLLRRGVNVFTDLQSTCDFVFWYLFYLNAPIKNMSYDLCTPQAFLGFKTFSHREFRRTKPGPRSAAACCTSQASRDSQVQNERPVHPPCWKRHMKRMLSGGSGGQQDPALRTQILHLRHQWEAPKVPHRASQEIKLLTGHRLTMVVGTRLHGIRLRKRSGRAGLPSPFRQGLRRNCQHDHPRVSRRADHVQKLVMGNMLPTITVAQMVSHVCGQAHAVSRGVCRPPRLRRPVMRSALASVTPVLVPWHSHVLKVAVGKLPQLAPRGGKSVAPSYRSFCHSFSQQLLVVLHTAWRIRSVATTAMPSPAAKLKAARRLPKRLRVSGEAPQGDIARMREEATARYERGESSSRTLHSCLQKQREGRADDYSDWRAAGTWSWCDDWNTPWYGATDWQQSAQATDSTASEPRHEHGGQGHAV